MNKSLKETVLLEVKQETFAREIAAVSPVANTNQEIIESPLKYVWFSMTEINKLGVNPQSQYDTPLGIYSYPFTKQYKTLLISGKLPFASDKKYIQFFNVTRGPVLNLNNYNQSMLLSDTEKLATFVREKNLIKDKEIDTDLIVDMTKPLSKINALKFFDEAEVTVFDHDGGKLPELGITIPPLKTGTYLNALYTSWKNNFKDRPLSFEIFIRIFVDVFHDKGFNSQNKPAIDILESVYADCVFRLEKQYEEIKIESSQTVKNKFEEWKKQAIQQSAAGWLWNITRNIGMLLTKTVTRQPKVAPGPKFDPRAMVSWTYVLRNVLGYVGAVDIGSGLIHPNEPMQAVWFSKDVCNVFEVIYNFHTSTKDVEPKRASKISRLRSWYNENSNGQPMTINNILNIIIDQGVDSDSESLEDLLLNLVGRLKPTEKSVKAMQKLFNYEMYQYANDLGSLLLDDGIKNYRNYVSYLDYSKVEMDARLTIGFYEKMYCNPNAQPFFKVIYPLIKQTMDLMYSEEHERPYKQKLLLETLTNFLTKNTEFIGDNSNFNLAMYNSLIEASQTIKQEITQTFQNDQGLMKPFIDEVNLQTAVLTDKIYKTNQ